MPVYLLGISRSRDLLRAPGGGTRWVCAGELAGVVVGPRPTPPRPAEHARLLGSIHAHIDVLPVQYGLGLAHDAAVRKLLEAHHRELTDSLDRLAGTCEMGLRIAGRFGRQTPRAGNRASVSLGSAARGYLALRRAQYAWEDAMARQADRVASDYISAIGDLVRGWRRLTGVPPRVVRLALLVDRQRADPLRARLEAVQATRPEERSRLVGPWPPYSFV